MFACTRYKPRGLPCCKTSQVVCNKTRPLAKLASTEASQDFVSGWTKLSNHLIDLTFLTEFSQFVRHTVERNTVVIAVECDISVVIVIECDIFDPVWKLRGIPLQDEKTKGKKNFRNNMSKIFVRLFLQSLAIEAKLCVGLVIRALGRSF